MRTPVLAALGLAGMVISGLLAGCAKQAEPVERGSVDQRTTDQKMTKKSGMQEAMNQAKSGG